MANLDRTLRRGLENTVKQARRVAEAGARKAVEQLAVHHHEPWPSMSPEQRQLRNRLRAHGRQLGDLRDDKRGTQSIDRLVGECAYEHWHRMLFARFLAENELLIEPEHGVAISLEDCRELARAQGQDWLELASSYAVRMLQQVFRPDDPVLEVALSPETTSALEDLLKKLSRDVFTASDSLGWCYQFWQAERKDEVNAAGNKIGADELPAVTQLFTEDYMVDFLLDNTLGAWHAGKVLAANYKLADTAQSEEELRNAVALPGCPWKYLRFIKGKDGKWTPAAGTFDRWPKTAKELKCLDPCMGSGHFVVAMFERLVALRLAEEKLDEAAAVAAVIRDNLSGLEIDPRCTQIGAFNLALAAWRRVGYCALPPMNIACSGLAPNTREADWLAIAGDSEKLRNGMARLYRLFKDAPVLGSLINPRAAEGDLLVAAFHELQPLLERALAQETKDDTAHEMAVTARGLAKAAEILAGQFTLVATNVPYLGRGNQDIVLKEYCDSLHPNAKADLATCFVERCIEISGKNCTTALVSTQYWLFLTTYKKLREKLFKEVCWNVVSRLGSGAFETISGEVVNVALLVHTRAAPSPDHEFTGMELSAEASPREKATALRCTPPIRRSQKAQLSNPNSKLVLETLSDAPSLEEVAIISEGLHTGDYPRFGRNCWEIPSIAGGWSVQQGGVTTDQYCSGLEHVLFWEEGDGKLIGFVQERLGTEIVTQWIKGDQVWGRCGVAVGMMGDMKPSLYQGSVFTHGICAIVPKLAANAAAIRAFCESGEFCTEVRKLDQKVCAALDSVAKVPFDLAYWQKVAAEKYPHGLPKPFSSDPTQWLFDGQPQGSDQPLHVGVARLLGYRWPRQTGSSFPDCPALGPDGLETQADEDGIVCLSATKGEAPAAARLRALLATAFGSEWSAGKERELLTVAGSKRTTLEDWLLDEFFEQHSALFHHRPFVWHFWDGRRDGFNVLVNYHRLAAPNGEGRRTLEKIIYTYLGDWITQQRRDQQAGVEGTDARLAAALHLQEELKKILEGEPPYDLFVRWKSLHEQAIGWDPDINDGVRLNIRPFMTARPLYAKAKNACILRATPKSIKWDKDRGKEPERAKQDYPWFWGWDEKMQDFTGGKTFDGNRWNDLHYTNAFKQGARDKKGGTK